MLFVFFLANRFAPIFLFIMILWNFKLYLKFAITHVNTCTFFFIRLGSEKVPIKWIERVNACIKPHTTFEAEQNVSWDFIQEEYFQFTEPQCLTEMLLHAAHVFSSLKLSLPNYTSKYVNYNFKPISTLWKSMQCCIHTIAASYYTSHIRNRNYTCFHVDIYSESIGSNQTRLYLLAVKINPVLKILGIHYFKVS